MALDEVVFGGRYRVVALLGGGGLARVYQAVDERLRRVVAIKALNAAFNEQPRVVARFLREARLAARLNHPHIIGIHDIATDESGVHYIVMEYVAGETLKDLISRAGALPPAACLPLLRQLCEALDAAHALGVIHRDIKPANIFLTETHQVKVGDFGIARALGSTGLTTSGMVLGSAPYLAPEQAQGQPATARTDLYATGVVLFEMLTGRLPFTAATPLAMAMQHVEGRPPAPSRVNPSVPRGLDAVVLRALAKDPAARYASGAELVAALERAVARPDLDTTTTDVLPHAPEAPPPPLSIGERAARRAAPLGGTVTRRLTATPKPIARPSRRTPVVVPLLLAAIVAGAGLVWAATQGRPQAARGHPTPPAVPATTTAQLSPTATPSRAAGTVTAVPTAAERSAGLALSTSTPHPTATSVPTATRTPLPSPTVTRMPTATRTPLPSPTATQEPTATHTPVPRPTATRRPTATSRRAGMRGAPPAVPTAPRRRVATRRQIVQAISHANDVYMQVMNRRDTSGVDSAFGPALAAVNRAVAADLAARHVHYAIQLLRLSITSVTMMGPTVARVGVIKTESDPLYADDGRLIWAGSTYTVWLVDIVQQSNGRWLVTQVYH